MDGDTASKFVSSLVKSIQALCNGYIDFSSSIEVIGHIHLRIDQNQKFNYVLSEEVSKSKSEAATVFASHSYHSQPPPSITPGDSRSPSQTDSPSRHRRKSQQVPRVDESDSLTVSALQPDVPSVSKEKTLGRVSNSGDSPHSGTISDTDLTRGVKKHENGSRVGKQVTSTQDSLDRRRKLQTESRPHDSAAKRSRPSGGSAANTGYEVIEIKEEPDDCSDYFGDDSAAGQDISQPDFSNLVAESLDRVGQMEGSSLLSGQHDQPFPVMLHANQSSSTTGLPGTSDQGAVHVASSSGVWGGAQAELSGGWSVGVGAQYPRSRVCSSEAVKSVDPSTDLFFPWSQGNSGITFTGRNTRRGQTSTTNDVSAENFVIHKAAERKVHRRLAPHHTHEPIDQLSRDIGVEERLRIQREKVRQRVALHRARKRARELALQSMVAAKQARDGSSLVADDLPVVFSSVKNIY